MSQYQSRRSSIRFNIAALALVAGALGYLNWVLWSRPIDISAIVSEATTQPETAKSDLASTSLAHPQPPGDLSQTTARPLFSANRRPPDPKNVEVAQAVPVSARPVTPPEQFQLMGIISAGQEPKKALIRLNNDPQGTWLPVGDALQGWRIQSITDDMAIIETEGRQYELHMYFASAAPNGVPGASTR